METKREVYDGASVVIEPVRYEHKEIDLEIFKNFFDECGSISKFDNDTEISPIWKKIYEDWIGE